MSYLFYYTDICFICIICYALLQMRSQIISVVKNAKVSKLTEANEMANVLKEVSTVPTEVNPSAQVRRTDLIICIFFFFL